MERSQFFHLPPPLSLTQDPPIEIMRKGAPLIFTETRCVVLKPQEEFSQKIKFKIQNPPPLSGIKSGIPVSSYLCNTKYSELAIRAGTIYIIDSATAKE